MMQTNSSVDKGTKLHFRNLHSDLELIRVGLCIHFVLQYRKSMMFQQYLQTQNKEFQLNYTLHKYHTVHGRYYLIHKRERECVCKMYMLHCISSLNETNVLDCIVGEAGGGGGGGGGEEGGRAGGGGGGGGGRRSNLPVDHFDITFSKCLAY